MKKIIVCLFISGIACSGIQAQKISIADKKLLIKKEDSLKIYADSMINASELGSAIKYLSEPLYGSEPTPTGKP